MKDGRITQIIPGDGWLALYKNPDPNEPPLISFVTCWALISDGDQNDVVGLDLEDGVWQDMASVANFLRYRKDMR